MVIRGPAPLSLALAILEEQGDKIVLTNWAETDFRTHWTEAMVELSDCGWLGMGFTIVFPVVLL